MHRREYLDVRLHGLLRASRSEHLLAQALVMVPPFGMIPASVRSLVGRVEPAPHSSLAIRVNRSPARTGTRAFRGINGSLPTFAALRRAPSIYSTVPMRPCCIAALLVSHGDRRMRGRTQLNSPAHAEGFKTGIWLPRKLGQRA